MSGLVRAFQKYMLIAETGSTVETRYIVVSEQLSVWDITKLHDEIQSRFTYTTNPLQAAEVVVSVNSDVRSTMIYYKNKERVSKCIKEFLKKKETPIVKKNN